MTDSLDHASGEDHEHGALVELVTLRDWLRYAVTRFSHGGLFFGHGCADAYDEAVWLLLHTLSLPLDRLEPFLDACITSAERETLLEVIERRVNERLPAAYLTGEAWLGDFRFKVDRRVIVPRSFFAELLGDGLEPWIDDVHRVTDALDLCTGSGCLAILMSHVFPNAQVVGVDLSDDALVVAGDNVAAYGLDRRVELLRSDVYSAVAGRRFDLIISNPPYVTSEAMDKLPPEYLHEPRMALAAGEDGLGVIRRIVGGARDHLRPGGVLAVEVGHNRPLVDAAFPEMPLIWLSAGGVEDCVFVISEMNLPTGDV